MATIRSAFVLCFVAAAFVAACASQGRTFQVTLGTDDTRPLPVNIRDETGLVTGITEATVDSTIGFDPSLKADPSDPNASILTWQGGGCDTGTDLTFHVVNGSYLVNIASHEGMGSCSGGAVPRAIRIVTSRAIPASSISVAGG